MRFSFALLFVTIIIFIGYGCRQQAKEPVAKNNGVLIPSANPYVAVDRSPLDVSYYPAEFPIMHMEHRATMPLVARVIYSRPHKNNRRVFGADSSAVCPYGKPWRLGANEATEISFYMPVSIGGQTIPVGTYTLYAIPQKDSWTIVLNSYLHTWGLQMDESKDILRTQIPVQIQTPSVEDFTMLFEASPDGASLIMAWDDVKTILPVIF